MEFEVEDYGTSLLTNVNPTPDEGEDRERIKRKQSMAVWNKARTELAEEAKSKRKIMTSDPEAAAAGEGEFDLVAYFQKSNERALKQGAKPKSMGVVVKDLSVVGLAPETAVISTNISPFLAFFDLFRPSYWTTPAPTTEILSGVSTFCKSGEMLLVLGRPGSGCSTLLRIIANMRSTYVNVLGEVKYGGISAEEFKHFRGEAIYTPEEDAHNPFLTLRQTLDFALKCKTPGNRLPESPEKFRERMITLLLTMFGLHRVADTIVGNEFLRGLSGGEKKRLTLMEAMVAAASITCWDCGTRGLDAASAYDYVKCLRVMTDALSKTTVCSFYQVSESIYKLFDRVVVLDHGKLIYFGPTSEAKRYFTGLGFICEPRKGTPDFITGVTNPQERKVAKGKENKVPMTSVEFERAWKQSKNCKAAADDLKAYEEKTEADQPANEFIEEVRAQKARGARKVSVYTVSYWDQIKACVVRQIQLRRRDYYSFIARNVSVLVQAFIYASVFFQMPQDENGLYSRGGALFAALLFNAMISTSELPAVFFGRSILTKHRSYALYHPSAYHLSQVITDLPFIVLQIVIFSVITYFMYGLVSDPQKFFIYGSILLLAAGTMTSLFRLLGNLTPSLYVAQQIQNLLLMVMICYSGFIIPYSKMRPWFQWIHWCNPLAYMMKSLVINEVRDQDYNCTLSAIPFGTGYFNPEFRTCRSEGASDTNLTVIGNAYLRGSLNYEPNLLPLDIIVILLFWFLFTLLNCLAIEFLEFTGGGYTKHVFKAGKAVSMDEVEHAKLVTEATESMDKTFAPRKSTFSWKGIFYTVDVGGKEKKRQLLDDIDGWIKPGCMTALMGSSGAGKTTLLDVLAQRKTTGRIEGEMLLNGRPLRIDYERITGYVEQMDIFNPSLTVLEALRFSAKMRQEPSVPLSDKYEYVEKVLEMMEMKHLAHALIGNLEEGVGISVEERKRLNIGMELVANPHILFLDEPTSGLDAQSSYNIIKFIRKLADTGMPLVCTIHQPSAVLFEYFDNLLLLARGGKTVYFGDIGKNSSTLVRYFAKNGARSCGKNENPAEYILEVIGAGVHGKASQDWPVIWKASPEREAVRKELENAQPTDQSLDDESPREFATDFKYQFWEVYQRLNIIWWRSPYYNTGRLFNGICVGLLLGFSYFNLGNSSSDLRSRIFILFQSMLVGILLIFAVIPVVYMQREYFRRDYASKFYSWVPFGLSLVLVEIPYLVFVTSMSFLSMYWAAGLHHQNSADSGFYLWLFMVIFTCYTVALGQSIAAMSIIIFQALILVPIVVIFLFLFCGVLNPPSALPAFWRAWMYPLMPTHYYLEGVVSDVLVGVQIQCIDEDFINVKPPPNLTCGAYFENFFVNYTGYLANPNATAPDKCQYCSYQQGSDYYENFIGWSFDNRWRNIGFILAYWGAAILSTTFFIFLNRKARR